MVMKAYWFSNKEATALKNTVDIEETIASTGRSYASASAYESRHNELVNAATGFYRAVYLKSPNPEARNAPPYVLFIYTSCTGEDESPRFRDSVEVPGFPLTDRRVLLDADYVAIISDPAGNTPSYEIGNSGASKGELTQEQAALFIQACRGKPVRIEGYDPKKDLQSPQPHPA
jgi:hypothetical protein